MRLNPEELEFLSAWAREEKAPDPYALPAHRLQAAHQVRGVTLIRAIKAWARAEGRRDEDIFTLYDNPNPSWPWPSAEELARLTPGAVESASAERSSFAGSPMTPADTAPDQPCPVTPEQEADYRSGDATVAWLLSQPGSFFRPYAGKWIAARDCQIIAVADNDRELMAQIDKADLRRIVIHRVKRLGKVIYHIPTNLSVLAAPPVSMFDLFGKAPGLRSAEDIASQNREERDAWGGP